MKVTLNSQSCTEVISLCSFFVVSLSWCWVDQRDLIQMWVITGNLEWNIHISHFNTLEQPKKLVKPWAGTPHWSPVPILPTTSSEEVKVPKNTFLENSAVDPWSKKALKFSNCDIRFGVIAQESPHFPSYHFSSILPCLQENNPNTGSTQRYMSKKKWNATDIPNTNVLLCKTSSSAERLHWLLQPNGQKNQESMRYIHFVYKDDKNR